MSNDATEALAEEQMVVDWKLKVGAAVSLLVVIASVISGVIAWSIGLESGRMQGQQVAQGCSAGTTTPVEGLFSKGPIERPVYDHFTDEIDPLVNGRWEAVIPLGGASVAENIGIQTVHSSVLPSGKVILVSAGSNRGMFNYPVTPNIPGTFLYQGQWPYTWEHQVELYQSLNMNGMYDPATNEFWRIPHPKLDLEDPSNSSWFLMNDLFCSGQNHVRDGNVLFTGGNEWYSVPSNPTGTFTGPTTTYIFNWTIPEIRNYSFYDWTVMPGGPWAAPAPSVGAEYYPWIFAGHMKEGRWYPRTVPLMDGRHVVVSGITNWDSLTATRNYTAARSPWIEFFDYQAFINSNLNGSAPGVWTGVDSSKLPFSPLNTPVRVFPPSEYVRTLCTSPTSANAAQCESLKNDTYRLYPQMYLLNDSRVLITGGGSMWFITSGGAPRQTPRSYLMTFGGSKLNPTVRFEHGPDHQNNITFYSTSVVDPNDPTRVLNFGGHRMHTYGGMIPGLVTNSNNPKIARTWGGSGRATRLMEVFTMPKSMNDVGNWSKEERYFMGDSYLEDRQMHFATLLPTKQILINGGMNYKYYGSVRAPLLLTPVYSGTTFTKKYTRRFVASARWGRCYHSIALLLADGRVLESGGNCGPPGVYQFGQPITVDAAANQTHVTGVQAKQNPALVQRKHYLTPPTYNQPVGFLEGFAHQPGELWQMEIYSPPYLFINGTRRVSVSGITWETPVVPAGVTAWETLNGKKYYLLHSLVTYSMSFGTMGLPTCGIDSGASGLRMIKLGSSSHGWDVGQKLYDLSFAMKTATSIEFTMPNATEFNIVPAFYHLFYVDCWGKPAKSVPVRFDDEASHPRWS